MTDDLHTIFSDSDCPPHETLRAYLDHRLTADERHRIETHLADCDLCADELEGLSLLRDPAQLTEIMDELGRRIAVRGTRHIRLSPRWVLAAAAALVLLIGGAFLFRYIVQTQKPPLFSEQEMKNQPMPPQPEAQPGSQVKSAGPGPRSEKRKEAGIKKIVVPEESNQIEREQSDGEQPSGAGSVSEMILPSIFPAPDSPTAETASGITSGIAVLTAAEAESLTEEIPDFEEPLSIGGILGDTIPSVPNSEEAARLSVKNRFGKDLSATEASQPAGMVMEQALDYYSSGQYRKAAIFFEKVIWQEPENFSAIYHLTCCYFELDMPRKALKTLEPLLKDPENDLYEKACELKRKISGKKL